MLIWPWKSITTSVEVDVIFLLNHQRYLEHLQFWLSCAALSQAVSQFFIFQLSADGHWQIDEVLIHLVLILSSVCYQMLYFGLNHYSLCPVWWGTTILQLPRLNIITLWLCSRVYISIVTSAPFRFVVCTPSCWLRGLGYVGHCFRQCC